MRSAEHGLRRLEAALDKLGPEALIPVLKQHRLTSIERVDEENLRVLKLESKFLDTQPDHRNIGFEIAVDQHVALECSDQIIRQPLATDVVGSLRCEMAGMGRSSPEV